MAGRFEGMSDLEWRLFEDIFPPAPPKRGRGMPHVPFRKIVNTLLLDPQVFFACNSSSIDFSGVAFHTGHS